MCPQWACVFLSRGKRGTKRPLAGVGAGLVHPPSHGGPHLCLPPAWEEDVAGTPTGGAGAEPTARGLGRLSQGESGLSPAPPPSARCGLALIQAPVSLWGQRAPGPAPAPGLPPPPSSPPPRAGQARSVPQDSGQEQKAAKQQALRLSAAPASPAPPQAPSSAAERTCSPGEGPSGPTQPPNPGLTRAQGDSAAATPPRGYSH